MPTQLAFLISKAADIRQFHASNMDFVVDRSVLEDIKIFAQLWRENYDINPFHTQLYEEIAKYILNTLPEPNAYIYCICSPEISRKRISHRERRSYEQKYPPNHIELLSSYYSKLQFGSSIPRIEIQTELFDFSDTSIMERICTTIFDLLESCPQSITNDSAIEGIDIY